MKASYVDFAVGASNLDATLALSIAFVNQRLPESSAPDPSLIFTYFFGKGIPGDWERMGYSVIPGLDGGVYRHPVLVEETGGTSSGKVAEVFLILDEKASYGSFRAFDRDKELPVAIRNPVDVDKDGLLESSFVLFQVSLSSFEKKRITILYSPDDVEPSYSTLSFSGSVKATGLGEERLDAVTFSKLNALNMSYDEVRGKSGINGNFRLSARNKDGEFWSFGPQPSGEVHKFSKNLAVQEKSGKIGFVEAAVESW